VVIPVVKGDFAASFRQREKPANRGAARLSGIGAGRGPDTGAALPNHPRYQLRYTRLFDFRFQKISLSVVIPVVKCDFAASFRRREKPANRGAARLSGIDAGHGPDTGAALPNHPRYQLRYTRIYTYAGRPERKQSQRKVLYNIISLFATDFLNAALTCGILMPGRVIS